MLSKKTPVIVVVLHLCVWLCLSVCACKGLSLVVVGSWHGGVATTPTSHNQPTSPDTNLHYWLHQARSSRSRGSARTPKGETRRPEWTADHLRKKWTGGHGPLPPVRDPGIGRPRSFPTQKAANRLLQEVSWTVLHPHSWLFSSSVTSNQHWGVQWTLCTQPQDLDFADDPANPSTNVKDLLEKQNNWLTKYASLIPAKPKWWGLLTPTPRHISL